MSVPKKRILVIIAVIIGTIILFANIFHRIIFRIAADFYYPFLNIPLEVEKSLKDKSLLLEPKIKLANAVSRLRRENDILKAKLLATQSVLAENYELRFLIDLQKRLPYKCVFAEIITRDIINWDKNFIINKGIDDGISQGATVLTYYIPNEKISDLTKISSGTQAKVFGKSGSHKLTVWALVGKISDDGISKHTARVNTIFSQQCKISVKIDGTKNFGITDGSIYSCKGKVIKLTYLPRDAVYKPYAEVLTSGLSRRTSEGIFVGWLMEKSENTGQADVKKVNNLYAEAKIIPAVKMDNIRFVIVITATLPEPQI